MVAQSLGIGLCAQQTMQRGGFGGKTPPLFVADRQILQRPAQRLG